MLALLLGFVKRPRQKASLFLSLAVAVIVLKTGGLTLLFLPALGPLLYFYVRQLTYPDRPFRRKDTLHFSSLLVAFWMPAWLVLISVIIYLYLAHRLIEEFYRRLRPVLMDRPRFAFRRLDRLLLLLGLLCLLGLLNDIFCFAVAFVLIGMAAEAILKPDSDIRLAMPITDRSDAREKGRRLKEAVAANRLYEDAELTLTTLAVKLMIHPHDLSRIINLGQEKNFNDFINEFRVREVARKMQDPAYDRLTLLGIAYESGFNSQRTFNRVFKEMTGKTPVEYKNGLKKELPNDKLASQPRIRPVILRPESPPDWAHGKLKRNYMFRNYWKIAVRQLRKQKMYAAIKIGGFALGIAACILIGLYIRDEASYDRTYPNAARIFRVISTLPVNGKPFRNNSMPAPMAEAYKENFPEVEYAGRVMPDPEFPGAGSNQVRTADQTQNTYEEGFTYADQGLLNVLKLPMVYGNRSTALNDPNTIVLSKTEADKYFPGQNPVGKILYLNNNMKSPYRISGVIQDFPSNSHLQYHFLLSLKNVEFFPGEQSNWEANNYDIYLLLRPGTNLVEFEKKSTAFMFQRHIIPVLKGEGLKNAEEVAKGAQLYLQPVTDIHLKSVDIPDNYIHGDIRFVWLFAAVACFVLVIASINFINLSTAKSANRAKEVGLRKVVGSTRLSLSDSS
jgi:putative ABC transport system permease protein